MAGKPAWLHDNFTFTQRLPNSLAFGERAVLCRFCPNSGAGIPFHGLRKSWSGLQHSMTLRDLACVLELTAKRSDEVYSSGFDREAVRRGL